MSGFEVTPEWRRRWKGERLGTLANKIVSAETRAEAMRHQRAYRKAADALLAEAWKAREERLAQPAVAGDERREGE